MRVRWIISSTNHHLKLFLFTNTFQSNLVLVIFFKFNLLLFWAFTFIFHVFNSDLIRSWKELNYVIIFCLVVILKGVLINLILLWLLSGLHLFSYLLIFSIILFFVVMYNHPATDTSTFITQNRGSLDRWNHMRMILFLGWDLMFKKQRVVIRW